MNKALSRSSKILIISLSILTLTYTTTTRATLVDSLTIGSAKALSLGHSVTADPPGIDSIHYNPAGLARLKGKQRHIKVLSADFGIELKFGEYEAGQQKRIDRTAEFIGEDSPYLVDEAYGATSKTEGATAMLPVFGMVDLPLALAPLIGFSFSPEGSDLTFGTNTYTPMFLGFNRKEDDPGRFMGEQLSLTMITYLSPTVAYQITDSLSFGASVNFNYAGVGIKLIFREPHEMFYWMQSEWVQGFMCNAEGESITDAINVCNNISPYSDLGIMEFEVEQPMALGFNLGLLWEPMDWITFGLAYNSGIDLDMNGDFQFPASEELREFFLPILSADVVQTAGQGLELVNVNLPTPESLGGVDAQGNVDPGVQGQANVKLEMPEHWAIGTSIQITPRLKVNMDVKWTGWSSFVGIPVTFDRNIGLLELAVIADQLGGNNQAKPNAVTFPLGLQDTWNWSIGTEFQYNDRLVLRAGIEDRPSATPPEARSPLVPLDEGMLYGAGFGYQLKKGTDIDFALGYFSSSLEMPACTSQIGNSCDGRQVIYNPYVGQDITADLNVFLVEFMYQQQF